MSAFRVIILAIAILAVIGGAVLYNDSSDRNFADQQRVQFEAAQSENQRIMSDLKIEDVIPGSGPEAQKGDLITAHYTLMLGDAVVESSRTGGEPFSFQLGSGQVIAGWDLGLVGVKPGTKRKLTVPPQLAYGKQGSGPIPPDATLTFIVEVLAVGKNENQAGTPLQLSQ